MSNVFKIKIKYTAIVLLLNICYIHSAFADVVRVVKDYDYHTSEYDKKMFVGGSLVFSFYNTNRASVVGKSTNSISSANPDINLNFGHVFELESRFVFIPEIFAQTFNSTSVVLKGNYNVGVLGKFGYRTNDESIISAVAGVSDLSFTYTPGNGNPSSTYNGMKPIYGINVMKRTNRNLYVDFGLYYQPVGAFINPDNSADSFSFIYTTCGIKYRF